MEIKLNRVLSISLPILLSSTSNIIIGSEKTSKFSPARFFKFESLMLLFDLLIGERLPRVGTGQLSALL